MAVKIRLRRMGAKKQPSYRLVAADEGAPRDGRFLEIVGHYNPLTNPATITVNEERILYWLGQGARPSDGAARVLSRTALKERLGLKVKKPQNKAEAAEGSEG
jgi:small subunit ribosomal protein S16